MDFKTLIILVLLVIISGGGLFILNEKLDEYKNEVVTSGFNAGLESGVSQISKELDLTVKEGCIQPRVVIQNGENTVKFVDTRCYDALLGSGNSEQTFVSGYNQSVKDLISLANKSYTENCKTPIIPLFSGDNTVDLIDARCLESIILNSQGEVGTGN